MFEFVWKYRGRLAAFALSFAAGLLLAFAYSVAAGLFAVGTGGRGAAVASRDAGCAPGETFASPEEVTGALASGDVGVRREIFRRLFLRPGVSNVYYDYERDMGFPERAEELRLRLVNLDDSPEDEALLTFVRADSPVGVVLKRCGGGWAAVAGLSSWLRFEDYPYADWIELPEVIRPGRHAIVVRESTGDATRYTRRVRVLLLVGGRLQQVAEVEEESIDRLEGYEKPDWGDVRRRRTARYSFEPGRGDSPARMRVEYTEDVVRYSGVAPTHTYWREGDGAWHQSRRHWRARKLQVIRPAERGEEQFVWNGQQIRFVREWS